MNILFLLLCFFFTYAQQQSLSPDQYFRFLNQKTPTPNSDSNPYSRVPSHAFLPPPSKVGPFGPFVFPRMVYNSGGLWWMIPQRGPSGRVWMIPRKASTYPIESMGGAKKMPPLPPPLIYPNPPDPTPKYTFGFPSPTPPPSLPLPNLPNPAELKN